MKVTGTGETGKKDNIAIERAQAEKQKETGAREVIDRKSATVTGSDRINIALGKVITNYLDPKSAEVESKSRVDEIKKLIEAKKYNPSSEVIAQAFTQVVGEEIEIERLINPHGADEPTEE